MASSSGAREAGVIGVCLKWVDRRPEVDPLTGVVHHDARTAGASDADRAALEWALRTGATWSEPVVAVTAGPAGADAVLREALAAGADRAVRVDLDPDHPSPAVADGLAPLLAGCRVVWCGDASLDRGSGSVPAFLAARLDAAQALGLVAVEVGGAGRLGALRRLDRGRRESLDVPTPAVCSVEGATARLRRATLTDVLAAQHATVDVVVGPPRPPTGHHAVRPYRPRARTLPPPAGEHALDRVRALTALASPAPHGPPEVLTPAEAAERILADLAAWDLGQRPVTAG